ncbi:hypothetical protein [Massilia glaciei]|uniref:Uncharacterized protein n=1 Tax=Massilia glaciei TaxID=1524097 RepID=A0A2U2HFX8_9BURK|nr:hypothetical protein [Massilia glaciei]PWF43613.1 hypothetical protein C7C56_020990 [Massilia glaciei]
MDLAIKIEDWRDWCGSQLPSEQDFGFAWMSLGICQAAMDRDLGGEYDFLDIILAQGPLERGAEHLEDALYQIVQACTQRGRRIPWRFPVAARRLRDISPTTWRDAGFGIELRTPSHVTLRFKLLNQSAPGLQAAWRAPLARLGMTNCVISGGYAGRDAQLRLGWPLRIAYFEANKPADLLEGLASASPAGRLSGQFALGREQSKCDVLVFWGSAAKLIERVRAGPGRIKGKLLLLVSKHVPAASTMDRLFKLTRASGVVVIDPRAAGHRVDQAINAFVLEFSLDQMCDAALVLGMERHIPLKFVQLTEALARLRIQDVAGTLMDSLPAFKLELPGAFGGNAQSRNKVLNYSTASDGATILVDIASAIKAARPAPAASAQRADRYLQQQYFVLPDGRKRVQATHGFVAGMAAEVDVRIGPAHAEWQALQARFIDTGLFAENDTASLTVWLMEPTQMAEPVSGKLTLPRDGAIAPCTLRFTPLKTGQFEARITVLHHGRVVQTALLSAGVGRAAGELAAMAEATQLQKTIPVRHNLGEIAHRRYFDLAIVENHTLAGEVRTIALSAERAWIANAAPLIEHWGALSASLIKVAQQASEYVDGIEGAEGRAVLIGLARNGSYIGKILIGQHLKRPGNNAAIAKEEYIQVVSMRSGTLPIEFVYDFPAPLESAALCEHWRAGIKIRACPGQCGGGTSDRVCPMGFWGISKVIERHQLSYEHSAAGKEYFLQSEPTRHSDAIDVRGPVVFSSSKRVPEAAIGKLRSALAVPGISAVEVGNWEQWADKVVSLNPRLILSMPHAAGTQAGASLEISEKVIRSIDLTADHVCPRPDGKPPLVILLGRDVAQASAAFSRHLTAFNSNGAAAVVATIATVAGSQAAAVASMIAAELLKKRDQPFRLGEAIREVKRQALLQNLIMPLCVVAYGDADWRIDYSGDPNDQI